MLTRIFKYQINIKLPGRAQRLGSQTCLIGNFFKSVQLLQDLHPWSKVQISEEKYIQTKSILLTKITKLLKKVRTGPSNINPTIYNQPSISTLKHLYNHKVKLVQTYPTLGNREKKTCVLVSEWNKIKTTKIITLLCINPHGNKNNKILKTNLHHKTTKSCYLLIIQQRIKDLHTLKRTKSRKPKCIYLQEPKLMNKNEIFHTEKRSISEKNKWVRPESHLYHLNLVQLTEERW